MKFLIIPAMILLSGCWNFTYTGECNVRHHATGHARIFMGIEGDLDDFYSDCYSVEACQRYLESCKRDAQRRKLNAENLKEWTDK